MLFSIVAVASDYMGGLNVMIALVVLAIILLALDAAHTRQKKADEGVVYVDQIANSSTSIDFADAAEAGIKSIFVLDMRALFVLESRPIAAYELTYPDQKYRDRDFYSVVCTSTGTRLRLDVKPVPSPAVAAG